MRRLADSSGSRDFLLCISAARSLPQIGIPLRIIEDGLGQPTFKVYILRLSATYHYMVREYCVPVAIGIEGVHQMHGGRGDR